MNTRFIKRNDDGRNFIKLRKNIVLNRNINVEDPDTGEIQEVNVQTFNPTDEMLFEDGWEIYVTPELTIEEIISNARMDKLHEIERYDSSNEVNEFYIQEMPVWLDKSTRSGLMLRFNSELAMKKENTTLWYNGISFTLPLNTAIQMLYALEVYASECYDNTQAHLAAVEKLESLDEILEYNYRVGYPEKLNF
jgi:hypothetical protein